MREFMPPGIPDLPENLVVVTDANNRPLCHMPLEQTRSQNLFYRAVALLLSYDENSFVLRWKSGLDIDFPVYEALPSRYNPLDYCANCLAARWGITEISLKKIGLQRPCSQNDNTFTIICQGSLASVSQNLHAELFIVNAREMAGLRRAGCHLNPLLQLVLGEPQISAKGQGLAM